MLTPSELPRDEASHWVGDQRTVQRQIRELRVELRFCSEELRKLSGEFALLKHRCISHRSGESLDRTLTCATSTFSVNECNLPVISFMGQSTETEVHAAFVEELEGLNACLRQDIRSLSKEYRDSAHALTGTMQSRLEELRILPECALTQLSTSEKDVVRSDLNLDSSWSAASESHTVVGAEEASLAQHDSSIAYVPCSDFVVIPEKACSTDAMSSATEGLDLDLDLVRGAFAESPASQALPSHADRAQDTEPSLSFKCQDQAGVSTASRGDGCARAGESGGRRAYGSSPWSVRCRGRPRPASTTSTFEAEEPSLRPLSAGPASARPRDGHASLPLWRPETCRPLSALECPRNVRGWRW